MKRHRVLAIAVSLSAFALITFIGLRGRRAEAQAAARIPLSGSAIPQWVDELPSLTLADGTQPVRLEMKEFHSNVLPTGCVPPAGGPASAGAAGGTWTRGYPTPEETAGPFPRTTCIGPVILASRGTPTEVTDVNNLGLTASSNIRAWVDSTDQTLHWAGARGEHHQMPMVSAVRTKRKGSDY